MNSRCESVRVASPWRTSCSCRLAVASTGVSSVQSCHSVPGPEQGSSQTRAHLQLLEDPDDMLPLRPRLLHSHPGARTSCRQPESWLAGICQIDLWRYPAHDHTPVLMGAPGRLGSARNPVGPCAMSPPASRLAITRAAKDRVVAAFLRSCFAVRVWKVFAIYLFLERKKDADEVRAPPKEIKKPVPHSTDDTPRRGLTTALGERKLTRVRHKELSLPCIAHRTDYHKPTVAGRSKKCTMPHGCRRPCRHAGRRAIWRCGA